jgi:heme A synthase
MNRLRTTGYVALGVVFLHLVFGGIVRITGSGMGCGDHWPKCHGAWFPPLDRPDLIIELTHRYLAVLLILSLVALSVLAWRRAAEPQVGGRGGVLHSSVAALGMTIVTALFGAITVFVFNAASATVVHWTLAMIVLALIVVSVVRAGGFGAVGNVLQTSGITNGTSRVAAVAAAMAFLAVVFGGITAKIKLGAVACPSFPLCGDNPAAPAGSVYVQLTHRVLAFALLFHMTGVVFAMRKRGERGPVMKAAWALFIALVAQILIAGAMIGMRLPPVPRALHQGAGVTIWLTAFLFWYLAHRATRPPVPARSATGRHNGRGARGAKRVSSEVGAAP